MHVHMILTIIFFPSNNSLKRVADFRKIDLDVILLTTFIYKNNLNIYFNYIKMIFLNFKTQISIYHSSVDLFKV